MCYSKAEGGKRCFYHRNKSYKAAVAQVEGLPDDAAARLVEEAHERYESAVAALAADDTGLLHLRKRADAIEAGDTLGGDDLAVLRKYAPPKEPSQTSLSVAEALATGIPAREDLVSSAPQRTEQVPRADGPFAANLTEALATGKPMAPEDRVTKASAPSSAFEGRLAARLRGDTVAGGGGGSPFAGEAGEFPHGLDENQPPMLDNA